MNMSTYQPVMSGLAGYVCRDATYLVGLPYKPVYRVARACRMRDCHGVATVGAYCAFHDRLVAEVWREACRGDPGGPARWYP